MRKTLLPIFIFCALASPALAQTDHKLYAPVDSIVKTFGALKEYNLAVITDTITRPFAEKEAKARAIFYWIANNISLDPKAISRNDQRMKHPENVVEKRMGTALGFSLLFQEMCSLVKIRCLSIDGYVKNSVEEITDSYEEINHSWNVVQLGQSPEQWFYVDAAKASGYLDDRQKEFTIDFTSEYFFANRELFNLDHYPDNSAWQLGKGPGKLKSFYSLPLLSSATYKYGVTAVNPEDGLIKTKINQPVAFSFPYSGEKIETVILEMGRNSRKKNSPPMNFTTSGNTLAFSYSFKEEDDYPVHIIVNGRPFASYLVEVRE